MAMMVGRTEEVEDVEGGLFMGKFSVPFWAIARAFGRNATFWYRLEFKTGILIAGNIFMAF